MLLFYYTFFSGYSGTCISDLCLESRDANGTEDQGRNKVSVPRPGMFTSTVWTSFSSLAKRSSFEPLIMETSRQAFDSEKDSRLRVGPLPFGGMILFWPVIATGLFDRDVTDAQAVRYPNLYETGRLGLDSWQ